ncbi:unnamed protein product [Schistosoma intercalatum]|nr:unnamed protein product [Schistosoma intercalatum]
MKLPTNLSGYKRILQATIPPIFLTATFSGTLGILAACIGILAILSERNMIMYLHLCALTIVIFMEIGIASTSCLMNDQFFTEAHRSLNTNVKQYWTNLRYQIEFDDLQTTFRCCGADSSNDYPHVKQLLPISCLSGIKPYSLVFGVVLLALGIQPQITLNQFRTILQNAKPEIFLAVSISGGLGVLGSCVGIYGHSKKQKVIIYMNIVVLFIVTCMWIGMAFKVALTEDRFPTLVNSSLSTTVKQYEKRIDCQMEFDQLQKSFFCCGASSYKDYPFNPRILQIPSSCKYAKFAYPKGCVSAIIEYTQTYLNIIMYLCFTFGIIQAVYLILSFLRIRKFEGDDFLSA